MWHLLFYCSRRLNNYQCVLRCYLVDIVTVAQLAWISGPLWSNDDQISKSVTNFRGFSVAEIFIMAIEYKWVAMIACFVETDRLSACIVFSHDLRYPSCRIVQSVLKMPCLVNAICLMTSFTAHAKFTAQSIAFHPYSKSY